MLTLTFIDLDVQIIPDSINLIGLIIGLTYNLFFGNIMSAILGAVACGLAMYLIYIIGTALFKKEAMGGDIKLAIWIGAFLGWQMGLFAIYLSFVVGAFISIYVLAMKAKKMSQEIPFGPAMAIATIITVLWGSSIINWYQSL